MRSVEAETSEALERTSLELIRGAHKNAPKWLRKMFEILALKPIAFSMAKYKQIKQNLHEKRQEEQEEKVNFKYGEGEYKKPVAIFAPTKKEKEDLKIPTKHEEAELKKYGKMLSSRKKMLEDKIWNKTGKCMSFEQVSYKKTHEIMKKIGFAEKYTSFPDFNSEKWKSLPDVGYFAIRFHPKEEHLAKELSRMLVGKEVPIQEPYKDGLEELKKEHEEIVSDKKTVDEYLNRIPSSTSISKTFEQRTLDFEREHLEALFEAAGRHERFAFKLATDLRTDARQRGLYEKEVDSFVKSTFACYGVKMPKSCIKNTPEQDEAMSKMATDICNKVAERHSIRVVNAEKKQGLFIYEDLKKPSFSRGGR